MEIVDLLLETLPEEAPPGIWSIDDPGFCDELNRRCADTKTKHWKTLKQIRDEL
jgi:hypothetical protein